MGECSASTVTPPGILRASTPLNLHRPSAESTTFICPRQTTQLGPRCPLAQQGIHQAKNWSLWQIISSERLLCGPSFHFISNWTAAGTQVAMEKGVLCSDADADEGDAREEGVEPRGVGLRWSLLGFYLGGGGGWGSGEGSVSPTLRKRRQWSKRPRIMRS